MSPDEIHQAIVESLKATLDASLEAMLASVEDEAEGWEQFTSALALELCARKVVIIDKATYDSLVRDSWELSKQRGARSERGCALTLSGS